MSSINVDLDFQDYTPTTSQGNVRSDTTTSATTKPQSIPQPEVQVRIPISGDNFKQNIQNAASVLNVLQSVTNLQQGSSSTSAGLSDEALEQLVWLSGRQKNKQQRAASSSWGLGYFAQYFDVTTDDVLQRILWSAVPVRKTGLDLDDMSESELTASLTNNMAPTDGEPSDPSEINSRLYEQLNRTKRKHYSYIERFIQSRPDFFGPFWICITLIFAVAIFSNIVSFKKHRAKMNQIELLQASSNITSGSSLSEELEEWHYSMDELNASASCVMFYMCVVPTLLWLLFWFRGCAKYYSLNETICAYGYSLSIFVPLSLLLMIQVALFRFIAISLASLLSGLVLVMSFLPIIHSDPNKGGSYIFLILIPVCHFSFAYILHRIMSQ